MDKIETYRQLDIWKKGMELVKDVYSITRDFPKEEKYGLTSQMRRAAVSVPVNVAEGFKRYHNKEYRQFLYISMGSTAELETLITISRQLEYLDEVAETKFLEKLDHLGRMLTNLIKKLSS